MIRIFFIDSDCDYYRDLKSWLPDFCTIHQIKFNEFYDFTFNPDPLRDIFLLDPAYTGENPEIIEPLILRVHPVPVIIISETVSLPLVVSMIKMGAYTCLHKKQDKSLIIEALKNILYSDSGDSGINGDILPEIVGSSPSLSCFKENLLSLSSRNISIHFNGETGTGKDLAARTVHEHSGKKKPLIAVNCGALSENILESELFGTRKGAFTDAVERVGLFEAADGSTIFLDEISELSQSAQVKLLRVLENGTFTRVGDSREISSRFRLITATNKNLKEEVEKGTFREDLYYRITSMILTIPPLRERKEDIPRLTSFFLQEMSCRKKVSPEAMEKLMEYNWPGNIRELRQVMERAEFLSEKTTQILKEHILFY